MKRLYANAANLVVFTRVILVLIAVLLLNTEGVKARVSGLVLLAVAALLDGADGYLARRLSISSRLGAQLDTLGDRITENVLFIFLAVQGLVSLWVPVIFVTRSFLADFVRALHDRRGVMGTFAMNSSRLGALLVASKISRAGYLSLKFAVFLAGGILLVIESECAPRLIMNDLLLLREAIWWGAVVTTAINLLRFVLLLHDSRNVLKEEFGW